MLRASCIRQSAINIWHDPSALDVTNENDEKQLIHIHMSVNECVIHVLLTYPRLGNITFASTGKHFYTSSQKKKNNISLVINESYVSLLTRKCTNTACFGRVSQYSPETEHLKRQIRCELT